uniref:Uncharacterized protein n=1 Tax=Arundo donax TaxID=35708 RepID=A0A0A9B0G0_ARUDO
MSRTKLKLIDPIIIIS